jgi:hypothetical protein
MTEVSTSQRESVRKIESSVLQRLSTVGQVTVAKAMDVSESTVSRLKDGQITVVSQLLAALGLKLAPADFKVVDPARAQAMYTLYEAAMSRMSNPCDLLWEDSENVH